MPEFEVNEDMYSLGVHKVLDYERNKASYNFVKSALLVNSELAKDKALAETIEPEKISLNDINQAIRYIYSDLLGNSSYVLYPSVTQVNTTNTQFSKYNDVIGNLRIGTRFKFYASRSVGMTSSYIFSVTRINGLLTVCTRNSIYTYKIESKDGSKEVLENLHFEVSKEDIKMLDTMSLLQELYMMQ